MNIITIFHRMSDRGIGWDEFSAGDTLEVAYAYVDDKDEWDEEADDVDPLPFLSTVYRRNNAVDGSEINVQKGKRSLSVGDVVGLPNNTFWTVNRLGWGPVDEIDVGLALTGRVHEVDAGLCPRCESQSLKVPIKINALSYTTRDSGDTPVYVCSDCGEDEAWQELAGRATPQEQWPVVDGYRSPFQPSEDEPLEMEGT